MADSFECDIERLRGVHAPCAVVSPQPVNNDNRCFKFVSAKKSRGCYQIVDVGSVIDYFTLILEIRNKKKKVMNLFMRKNASFLGKHLFCFLVFLQIIWHVLQLLRCNLLFSRQIFQNLCLVLSITVNKVKYVWSQTTVLKASLLKQLPEACCGNRLQQIR